MYPKQVSMFNPWDEESDGGSGSPPFPGQSHVHGLDRRTCNGVVCLAPPSCHSFVHQVLIEYQVTGTER